MRRPHKLCLAFVLAAALATGCGSDDDSSSGADGGSDKAKTSEKDSENGSEKSGKPKGKRGQMVKCIEDEGFEVSHEGEDEATATNYTIEARGKKKATIIIHPNKNDAAGSSRKIGEEKGVNAIPFGRTEFRRADTSTDREAGVLANCVAEAYVH